jgi:hypothetical protein
MKNKLNTEKLKLLIPDYITGSLSEEEYKIVKQAIEQSDEVRELYSVMKNAFEFTGSVKFEEPAPQYWNNLLPRIHQKIDEREQQSLAKNPMAYFWKILVPAAAVVLIFIIYRITFTPSHEFTQKAEIVFEQVKIDIKDTVKTENVQHESENVTLKYNVIKSEKLNYKKKYIKDNKVNEQYVTESNIVEEESEESEGFAAITVEQLTIFGADTPGILDDDLDTEIDKLTDSDRDEFLKELNINL